MAVPRGAAAAALLLLLLCCLTPAARCSAPPRLATGLGCEVRSSCGPSGDGQPCGCTSPGCACGDGYGCHTDGFCYGCTAPLWGNDCRRLPPGCGCTPPSVCHPETGACSADYTDTNCTGLYCGGHGHGRYHADTKRCTCVCNPGSTGHACELTAGGASCPEDQCNFHGLLSGTACLCTCQAGFDGARCDQCAAGHIDYPYCRSAVVGTPDDSVVSCACKTGYAWCGGTGSGDRPAGCYETQLVLSLFPEADRATCLDYPERDARCEALMSQYTGSNDAAGRAALIALLIVSGALLTCCVVGVVILHCLTPRHDPGGPEAPKIQSTADQEADEVVAVAHGVPIAPATGVVAAPRDPDMQY